jgi:hypothetical protein
MVNPGMPLAAQTDCRALTIRMNLISALQLGHVLIGLGIVGIQQAGRKLADEPNPDEVEKFEQFLGDVEIDLP